MKRHFLLALLVLLQTACENPADPTARIAEDRGTALTPAEVQYSSLGPESSSILDWSSNGSEIYYIRRGMPVLPPAAVKAVNVTTKTMRIVSGEAKSHNRIQLSQDGSTLYILAGDDPDRWVHGIYRVPSGGGSLQNVVAPRLRMLGNFSVAHDQSYLTFGAYNDSIFVRNLQNHEERFVNVGVLLGFSPTGEQFVYRDSQGSRLFVASTQNLDERELLDGCTEGSVVTIRWAAGTIQVLQARVSAGTTTIWLTNAGSCETRKVTEIARLADAPPLDAQQLSWSPDGNSVAYWRFQECVEWYQTIMHRRCVRGHYTLHRVDVQTGNVRQIGAAVPERETPPPSPPVYSRDNRRIAYVIEGVLYVKDLP